MVYYAGVVEEHYSIVPSYEGPYRNNCPHLVIDVCYSNTSTAELLPRVHDYCRCEVRFKLPKAHTLVGASIRTSAVTVTVTVTLWGVANGHKSCIPIVCIMRSIVVVAPLGRRIATVP